MDDALLIALVAVAMAVGIVGTVVPVLPGLVLVWAAALMYGLVAGFGPVGAAAFVVITALALAGIVVGVVVPQRVSARGGASPASRLLGAALAVAQRNGVRHAGGRIEWAQGSWFAPLASRRFEAIVSNPPYIAADDPALAGDGLRHEPHEALTPGGDGLSALLTLINDAPGHLAERGWLFLEHGAAQGEPLRSALVARGFTHVTSHRDLAGHERVTEGCWPHR